MNGPIVRPDIPLEKAGQFLVERYSLALQDAQQIIEDGVRSGRVLADRRVRGRLEQLPKAFLAAARFDHAAGTIARLRLPARNFSYQDTADEGDEPSLASRASVIADELDELPGDPVFVNTLQLRDYAEEIIKCSSPAAIGGARARHAGGAPRQIHWDELAIEAGAWVYAHGLPDPKAPLIRHLADWYSRKYGREVDEGEIRKRIVNPLIERCKS